nr:MAG TPA: hypothetical protein [Caudoviricetes sp.]
MGQKCKTSLCADCATSVFECSWQRRLKPRKDWTATETIIHSTWKDYVSYNVTACPAFTEPEPRKRLNIFEGDFKSGVEQ